MSNPIVIVSVTQTQAPTPNTLQKTGALISQGGTTLNAGVYSLLVDLSDLAALLAAPLALTNLVWASSFGGQVTATAAVAHGVTVNEQFVTTITDALPVGYNGTYLATSTGANTFTYYRAGNPGANSAPGEYSPDGVGELTAMATTFFAQGVQRPVYVLELGAGEAPAGVTALNTFITSSPQFFYSYLVPRSWAGDSTFLAFVANFEATTAKTYFFVTVNPQNYGLYDATMKDVVALMEAPTYRQWAANTISAATFSLGIVTATTGTAHGIFPGDFFTITGSNPTGYNGTYQALPGTSSTTLLYAKATDPGSYVASGLLRVSSYASAGVPATAFDHAADFQVSLRYDPNPINKVTPFAFSELSGVTAFPTLGNSAFTTALEAAFINYVGYGAEGGISNTILYRGNNKDGRPFNYWYSIDWMQINVRLNVANAIINGSNNPTNPLYLNQDGIDRLEQVIFNTGASAIAVGLALGTPTQVGLGSVEFADNLNSGKYAGNLIVNAIPFTEYFRVNPGDYKIGKYGGYAVTYTPLRGFDQVLVNINATDFVA